MEATQQWGHSGRLPMAECPRSFLDSIPSPIAPALPGNLGYVITKEHVEEMRRMEKLCEANEERAHREYKPVFLPVDNYLSKEINCELINVDIRSYSSMDTPFGGVYYSPRYNDDRYTYRHVILTSGVRKEAERIAATVPGGFLTEEVFVHYLGIQLSNGWSHFMVFNKQFKELILRRPKHSDAPATTDEPTCIWDGAPGPNDEIDSDSGDDAEQRAAISFARSIETARRQQEELEQQRQMEQPERPTAASTSRSESAFKARQPCAVEPAAPDTQQPHAEDTPQIAGGSAGEESGAAAPADSKAADELHAKVKANSCTGPVALESANCDEAPCESLLGAPKRESGTTQESKTQSAALQPPRRRKAPLSRAAPQSATAQMPQPKNGGGSSSDVAGRARGRVGVRRREPVVPVSSRARSDQNEPSGQSTSVQSVTTSTDCPGVSGTIGQKATARNAAALRPKLKVGVRHVPATTLAKAAVRTRGQLEQIQAAAGEETAGKKRLRGPPAVQEKGNVRQRRE